MKYISNFYELYTQSTTDLFESGPNDEYYQSGRGVKPDAARCFHSDKKLPSAI
jgi:hypothetical protein